MNAKIETVMERLQAEDVKAATVVNFLKNRIAAFLTREAGKDQTPLPATGSKASLLAVLGSCKGALWAVAIFSGIVNLLMLTGALFMMEVYDRVLPSRSLPTLVGLITIATILFAALGAIEIVRGRVLTRCGGVFDEDVGGWAFRAVARLPLLIGSRGDGLQPIRDLDAIRSFLMGAGPVALFDLPWIPLYLTVVFLLHPALGGTAAIGAVLLIVVTLLTEYRTRTSMALAAKSAAERERIAQAVHRNAEVVSALRMTNHIESRWRDASRVCLDAHRQTSDTAGAFSSISKVLRLALQAAILAMGAVLVIGEKASPGAMIAGSIIGARALAPVDGVIAQWKGFASARLAWARLAKFLTLASGDEPPMALPAPRAGVSVESLGVAVPGEKKLSVQDVSFALSAGQGLGVVGPSGSGKSSLLRAMVGAWPAARGHVRLDGADLGRWPSDALGRHIGYLPQDIELFHGTVADNIARFDPAPDPAAVVAAARTAGVHDLILRLPSGYDTELGEQGTRLSGGERQRIALARALFGDPFLIVLDEPNSNLDTEGEEALVGAIRAVKSRGGIVIVATHKPTLLAGLDRVLLIRQGKAEPFMPIAGGETRKPAIRTAAATVTRLDSHPAGIKPSYLAG